MIKDWVWLPTTQRRIAYISRHWQSSKWKQKMATKFHNTFWAVAMDSAVAPTKTTPRQ